MRSAALPSAALVAVFLAWVQGPARADRARPGAKETPAQQRANKARKDRARYGAGARVDRLSTAIPGGRMKAIRVERGGLLRERVRTVIAEPGGSLRIHVVQGEQGRVIRSSATRIVRKHGARFTETEVIKTDRGRVSRGSSYTPAGGQPVGFGESRVR